MRMPVVKISSLAGGKIHWRHHNQLKLKPKSIMKEDRLMVRFPGKDRSSKSNQGCESETKIPDDDILFTDRLDELVDSEGDSDNQLTHNSGSDVDTLLNDAIGIIGSTSTRNVAFDGSTLNPVVDEFSPIDETDGMRRSGRLMNVPRMNYRENREYHSVIR